jgi:hypothetical protein
MVDAVEQPAEDALPASIWLWSKIEALLLDDGPEPAPREV